MESEKNEYQEHDIYFAPMHSENIFQHNDKNSHIQFGMQFLFQNFQFQPNDVHGLPWLRSIYSFLAIMEHENLWQILNIPNDIISHLIIVVSWARACMGSVIGKQRNLAEICFFVFLIAVHGCVYVCLQKYLKDHQR